MITCKRHVHQTEPCRRLMINYTWANLREAASPHIQIMNHSGAFRVALLYEECHDRASIRLQ